MDLEQEVLELNPRLQKLKESFVQEQAGAIAQAHQDLVRVMDDLFDTLMEHLAEQELSEEEVATLWSDIWFELAEDAMLDDDGEDTGDGDQE